MTSRRDFLHSCIGTLAYPCIARHSWHPPRTLRVASIVANDAGEVPAALRFGAMEADRSARLFGGSVVHVSLHRPDAADDVDAWIMDAPGARPGGAAPVLRLVCSSLQASDGTFMLPPCDPPGDVWHSDLERFGAQQLNDRYRAATGSPMTSGAWLGWFAFKALAECALRARSHAPADLLRVLADPNTHFDGHMGAPLRFDASRRLVYPPKIGAR